MDTIEVPEICALAINNLPIVGRPNWRLTEGKHIVKLEITWQLPRETTQRRSNQRSSKKSKQLADGVARGVTKMADKMAAPMPTRKEEQLNLTVFSTPSTPMGTTAKSQGPSTSSHAATITNHSPEGEWKEVVSKKTRKKLFLSAHKTIPPRAEEQPVIAQRRKTPSPPPKKMRAKSPLQDPGREKLIAGQGREYPLHEKYYLALSQ